MADYLGEPDIVLTGDSLNDPIFQALFDLWREPDPAALVQVGLAACDFHTQRCRTNKGGRHPQWYEFDNRQWTRTPIELLLAFRLRQRLGLANPTLDHPLMNSLLGVLPPERRFEPDDLIRRVRARLVSDGYDEEEIFEICYV